MWAVALAVVVEVVVVVVVVVAVAVAVVVVGVVVVVLVDVVETLTNNKKAMTAIVDFFLCNFLSDFFKSSKRVCFAKKIQIIPM